METWRYRASQQICIHTFSGRNDGKAPPARDNTFALKKTDSCLNFFSHWGGKAGITPEFNPNHSCPPFVYLLQGPWLVHRMPGPARGLERGDDNLTFDCKQQAISLVPNPELSWRKSKMRCPKSQNWFCIDKWRIKNLIGTVNVFKAIGWEAWQFWAEIPFSTGNFYRIHCNEFTAAVIITTKQIGFPY